VVAKGRDDCLCRASSTSLPFNIKKWKRGAQSNDRNLPSLPLVKVRIQMYAGIDFGSTTGPSITTTVDSATRFDRYVYPPVLLLEKPPEDQESTCTTCMCSLGLGLVLVYNQTAKSGIKNVRIAHCTCGSECNRELERLIVSWTAQA
jgi:hypothetical protein